MIKMCFVVMSHLVRVEESELVSELLVLLESVPQFLLHLSQLLVPCRLLALQFLQLKNILHLYSAVFRIRIHRICMFLGL
jgi:hypothetical protein